MKTKFTFLAILVIASLTSFAQQPPNGGFETFTNSYTPARWVGVEDISSNLLGLTTSIFTFQDSTTFTQGAASIKLVSDTIAGYVQLVGTIPGLVSLGGGTLDGNENPSFRGLAFTYRPDTLIFDYKLTTPGIDSGAVNLLLSRTDTAILQLQLLLAPDSNWVHVEVPMDLYYINNNTPDTLLLQFVSSNPNSNPVIGTTLHIDAVSFGYVNPAGIANTSAPKFSVYPNPANNILHITADRDLAGFNLQLFDIVGRLVNSEVLTSANNAIDISHFANGTYVYRIADKENNVITQSKLSVVK